MGGRESAPQSPNVESVEMGACRGSTGTLTCGDFFQRTYLILHCCAGVSLLSPVHGYISLPHIVLVLNMCE
jgi:hypothetical protein